VFENFNLELRKEEQQQEQHGLSKAKTVTIAVLSVVAVAFLLVLVLVLWKRDWLSKTLFSKYRQSETQTPNAHNLDELPPYSAETDSKYRLAERTQDPQTDGYGSHLQPHVISPSQTRTSNVPLDHTGNSLQGIESLGSPVSTIFPQ
jgi:hypothetical protein